MCKKILFRANSLELSRFSRKYQEVQEVMAVVETTVDNVSFKDWLQRYSLLLYMIQNSK